MKWSGLHTSLDNEAPFGKDVVDDIEAENAMFGTQTNENNKRSMENVKHSLWYKNEYFEKARWQLERTNSKYTLPTDGAFLFVNGRFRDINNAVLTDLAVVPREKPHTGAAAREQPRDSPVIER